MCPDANISIIKKFRHDFDEIMTSISDLPYKVAFPKILTEYVTEMHNCFGFSCDSIVSSMLVATATAIGSSKIVKVKNGAEFFPNLFVAIVGDSGTGKTPLLNLVFKPLIDRNNQMIEDFSKIFRQYEKECQQASADEISTCPVCHQLLVSDITQEALVQVLKDNPEGIGIYCDELLFWLNSFNKYRKGGDTQFWLSLYSSSPVYVNRKTEKSVVCIPKPCVSLIGGVQPEVFMKAFSGENQDNGLLYRILQVHCSEDCSDHLWQDAEFPEKIENGWASFIESLIDERTSCPLKTYRLDDEARLCIQLWASENRRALKEESAKPELEAFSKLEIIAVKIAVILHVMRENTDDSINHAEATFATLFCDFYLKQFKIGKPQTNNKAPLSLRDKVLFESLPNSFSTNEAHIVGEQNEIPERTVDEILKRFNGSIISRLKPGHWQKN